MAREIRDELGHALTAIKMDLSWLASRLPEGETSLLRKTQSMGSLIDNAIQTVRRISAELRPGLLDDLGLAAATEWQAREFERRSGIACDVQVEPDDFVLDQDRSTALFRILQETLSNVTRHAGATKVKVDLTVRHDHLSLRVVDDGRGITEEEIHSPSSLGLVGMRERVYRWKGEVNISGKRGKGTTVMVTVPLSKENES